MVKEESQVNEQPVWDRLAAPFTDEELEWRVQSCGKKGDKIWAIIVPYVQSRAIMDRLDSVVGPEGWADSYRETSAGGEDGYICTLAVKGVCRQDGSPASAIEPIKGGISGALKRAAVKFGMGRYLYHFPIQWATGIQSGYGPAGSVSISDKKNGIQGYCFPPKQADIAGALDKIASADPGEVPEGDREGFSPKETAIAKKRSKCAYCDNGSHVEPGDQLVISTYGKDNKKTWGHRVCWFNLKAGE